MKPEGYLWLSEGKYAKLVGQARLHLEMYGQTPIVEDAKKYIMELLEQYNVKYRWFE